MSELTTKQQELLAFIEGYQVHNGFPPSYREMQLGLGLSSPSQVQSRLNYLEKAGLIRRINGQSRSVQLVRKAVG